jgi:arginine decarboxylase-like protein
VTQPLEGATQSGASGFAKGVGKGLGSFLPKLTSACLGMVSHPMKGMHEEVVRRFGSNVQSHLVASRVTQGYDEWLQSSDEEKQDVIERWNLIKTALKKRRTKTDEIIHEILRAQEQRTRKREDGRQSST